MQSSKKFKVLGVASLFTLAMMAGGAGLAHASIDISLDGGNGLTGPNSENENEWNIYQDIDIDIDNRVTADNDIDLTTITGMLEVENNTAVDGIWTGDIWGTFEVSNILNNRPIAVADFGGGFNDINISFANDTTGPFSDNQNEANIFANVDIDIDNEADIDNDQSICASTGGLEIEHNTIVGDIRTGSIRVDSVTQNIANQNAGGFNLVGWGPSDVNADFSNVLTGPNSENENELNLHNNFDFDMENTARIDNDVKIAASTGGNEVENNTLVGDIETGSISIGTSISNVAN